LLILMLHGRDAERSAITELLDSARGATGGVLVLRGPPGAGKSALLNDASAHATGMLVLRTTGVESEFELPFAAVHQLLRPALSRLSRLPEPQAEALAAAFGQRASSQDNRFLVSVAVLGILDELATGSPVLCIIDDAHWLDDASASALGLWPDASRRIGSLFSSPPVTATFNRSTHQDCPNYTLAGSTPKPVESCSLSSLTFPFHPRWLPV
jgi:predicted ATPase